MSRTEAHERDRQRLRAVLQRAKEWRAYWGMLSNREIELDRTKRHLSVARYNRRTDRQRLRRVLQVAKRERCVKEYWSVVAVGRGALADQLDDTCRWSAAWKAAAKKHHAKHHNWKQGYHIAQKNNIEVREWWRKAEAERDELARRLEEAREACEEARICQGRHSGTIAVRHAIAKVAAALAGGEGE